MKKIMKVISAGLSALIGMSVMTATASAEMSFDYMSDENNIVWEVGNGIRCYENGEMINVSSNEYMLYIVPVDGVTAEDLGVEFTGLSDWIYMPELPDSTKAIRAENLEGLTALCDNAQNWYDEGLITYAYAFGIIHYGCIWGVETAITLKEADEEYDPTKEYDFLEDAGVEHNDTYDVFTITGYDCTKMPEISAQISADERVEKAIDAYSCCAAYHSAAGKIFTLGEISEEPETEPTISGDITGDDTVNLYDAIEISKYLMNMVEFSDATLALADYNADGDVNLYDVIDIAKTLM